MACGEWRPSPHIRPANYFLSREWTIKKNISFTTRGSQGRPPNWLTPDGPNPAAFISSRTRVGLRIMLTRFERLFTLHLLQAEMGYCCETNFRLNASSDALGNLT